MDNINTIERTTYIPKKSSKWRNLKYGIVLFSLFNFNSPANAQSTTPSNSNNNIELPINLWNGSEKQKTYNMPSIYKDKVYSFLKSDFPILGSGENSTWMFTVDFALKEMESDWWIGEDKQWTYVWHAILGNFGKDLIDIENEDPEKLEDFAKVFDKIEECWERYENWYLRVLDRISADNQRRIDAAQKRIDAAQKGIDEAQKRIDEAQKRIDEALRQISEYDRISADAQKQSAENIKKIEKWLNESLSLFKELYPFFKEHPDDGNLTKFKANAKKLAPLCDKYKVKYRDILPPEVRDFYGME